MSRRFLAVVLVLVVAVAAGSVVGCGGESDTVVKVGDTEITEEQLDTQVQSVAAQYGITEESNPEYFAQLRTDILEGMIDNEIAVQKAPDLGVTVAEEDLQTEIDSMIAYYYQGDETLLEDDLKTNNMTMEEFRAEYQKYLLVQRVREAVTADVTVSDDDIAAYYEANVDSYQIEDSRTVRHILITPGADDSAEASTTTTTGSAATTSSEWTDADWSAALAVAQEVRAELAAGGDWTKLAADYSDDTASADSGGDLGEVTMGEMVPEFEEAAFSLEAYEISQPVKSQYGYHILQVTGITPAHTQTLEEVKEEIRATLLSEAQFAAWSEWLKEARTGINVVYREEVQSTTSTIATTTTAAGSTITTAGAVTTTTE